MELTTHTQLAYFAALFVGVALGFVAGWLSRFGIGLGVGLLIPGIVAAHFGTQCLLAYREVGAGRSLPGVVVDVRDEPSNASGSITHELPTVRYRDAGGVERTFNGPAASGWQVGDRVHVLEAHGAHPEPRAQKPKQLRGGAIAMMLFGTFHLTLGLWFLLDSLFDGTAARPPASAARTGDGKRRRPALRAAAPQAPTAPSDRWAWRFEQGNMLFMLSVIGAMLWISVGSGLLITRFAVGFGLITATLLGYAVWSVLIGVGAVSTRLGYLVLGANFGAFAFALWLLSPAGGG